jgi:CMP/dCMP kinase
MKRANPIIAIDGPVGVGKSSVASSLAERLGFLYIDTGAMYRAVTLKAMNRSLDLQNKDKLAEMVADTELQFKRIDGVLRIFCDGVDVSDAIRLPEVSKNTSPVADTLAVRERLVALQQAMGAQGGLVMEGRDISTVVFPDAEIKLYLEADPRIRAERRYQELLAKGKEVTFEETYQDLLERDTRDRERPVGALQVADDAIVFDTSKLTQSEVIDALEDIVRNFDRIPS